MPSPNRIAITARNIGAARRGCMSQNNGHATSVPNVPGATGASPAPNPSAMKCAGFASRKRTLGRALRLAEMIKPALRQRHGLAGVIDHHHAAAGFHRTDARNIHLDLPGAHVDLIAQIYRRSEGELVVVSARERTVSHDRITAITHGN